MGLEEGSIEGDTHIHNFTNYCPPLFPSGLEYFPANRIAFNSVSRTKNKNGLLTLIVLENPAAKATNSTEDAATPTVPSLVTSIAARCLILLTLRGSSAIIPSPC